MEKLIGVSSNVEELRKRADQIENIIKLYSEGTSLEGIAYQYGITRQAVETILIKNNAK